MGRRAHSRDPKLLQRLAPLLLVVLSFAAFGRGLSGEFVSDDTNAIVANQWVTGPLRPVGIFTNLSWWGVERADAPGYRPLTTLSFALDHALVGLRPTLYHTVNIALHTLVCWLLLQLGLVLGLPPFASLAASSLFAVLPIHAEAVVWTVGRAELLASAGFLVTVLAGIAYLRRALALALLLSAAALLLGALAKENAVTAMAAPFVLGALGIDGVRSAGLRKRALVWLGVLAVAFAVYLALRWSAGSLLARTGADLLDNQLSLLPLHTRVAGALSILGRYLFLTVVPVGLTADYGYDVLGIGTGFLGDRYSLLAVAALASLAWALRGGRASPAVCVGILLSTASYAIVSNTAIQIGTIMAERLFYLPSAGLCLAAGAGFGWVRDRAPSLAVALLCGLVGGYALTCAHRAADWESPVTLFEAATRSAPRSARAHMELASAYGRVGRTEEALAAFDRALEILPSYATAYYNRGNLLARLGRLEESSASFSRAVDLEPRWAAAWHNLALVERMLGRADEALEAMDRAEQSGYDAATMSAMRGDLLLTLGRNLEAAEEFTKALAASADPTVLLVNRGVAHERSLGCAAAVDDYLAATRVASPLPQAFANAAGCLERLGRAEEAARLREQAVANRSSRR